MKSKSMRAVAVLPACQCGFSGISGRHAQGGPGGSLKRSLGMAG